MKALLKFYCVVVLVLPENCVLGEGPTSPNKKREADTNARIRAAAELRARAKARFEAQNNSHRGQTPRASRKQAHGLDKAGTGHFARTSPATKGRPATGNSSQSASPSDDGWPSGWHRPDAASAPASLRQVSPEHQIAAAILTMAILGAAFSGTAEFPATTTSDDPAMREFQQYRQNEINQLRNKAMNEESLGNSGKADALRRQADGIR